MALTALEDTRACTRSTGERKEQQFSAILDTTQFSRLEIDGIAYEADCQGAGTTRG
jgi:hypothetical protein